ncbi:hypothetical protein EVAR_9722_1 [Eumeta japonica]|uniref:Uncharacterized protein n=1 Tax=Eumeta variegata TaxID=151549 RepID=A0A4C1U5F9_EUMVA|nr:hypothetical protein EVAR_9722_1 [Eumeta japonica]
MKAVATTALGSRALPYSRDGPSLALDLFTSRFVLKQTDYSSSLYNSFGNLNHQLNNIIICINVFSTRVVLEAWATRAPTTPRDARRKRRWVMRVCVSGGDEGVCERGCSSGCMPFLIDALQCTTAVLRVSGAGRGSARVASRLGRPVQRTKHYHSELAADDMLSRMETAQCDVPPDGRSVGANVPRHGHMIPDEEAKSARHQTTAPAPLSTPTHRRCSRPHIYAE